MEFKISLAVIFIELPMQGQRNGGQLLRYD